MAQQDGVGNAGGEGLIRIAQDDVVDFGRSQGMLIADDGIAAGAFIQGVAGTDDFGIADVGAGVMIAVNQVIFAHGFFRSLQGIVDAHQLGRLGPISCVAAADGQYSTTGEVFTELLRESEASFAEDALSGADASAMELVISLPAP